MHALGAVSDRGGGPIIAGTTIRGDHLSRGTINFVTGLITFTGDNENQNVNNRVYDNTAKSTVDVITCTSQKRIILCE